MKKTISIIALSLSVTISAFGAGDDASGDLMLCRTHAETAVACNGVADVGGGGDDDGEHGCLCVEGWVIGF